jgi:hypothetical protein
MWYKLCIVSSHTPSEVRERVRLTELSASARVHERIGIEINIGPKRVEPSYTFEMVGTLNLNMR